MLTKIKSKLKYIIAAIAAIGDGVTTVIAVDSGNAYEYNPIAKSFQDSIGLIPANIVVASFFCLVVFSYYKLADLVEKNIYKKTLLYSTYVIVAFKLLVVLSNILVISKFN